MENKNLERFRTDILKSFDVMGVVSPEVLFYYQLFKLIDDGIGPESDCQVDAEFYHYFVSALRRLEELLNSALWAPGSIDGEQVVWLGHADGEGA